MPWLLHYQHRVTPDMSSLGVSHAAWIAWPTEGGASVFLVGDF